MAELEEKMQELRDTYIADDGYLYDALWECLNDVRQLLNAESATDKLVAIDSLTAKINASICNESKLEQEAQEAIDGYVKWSDIYAKENKSC